jgi:iron complex outermembrane receptor protein
MKSYLTFLIITLSITFNVFANSLSPTLEEVFVTAEKKSESLQDLSQAVTALGGDDLDVRQISSFVDLSAIAPGVNVAKNEGFKTVITIRGIGNEANQNAIANPSVSYHLDGVYIASPFSLQTDFMDLERVEVLRGPQGTLFGQNSTGGAINVITQAPSLDDSFGKFDVTLGNYDLRKFRTSYNQVLSDTTAIRGSIISNKRDGFTENLTLGQDLDDANSLSGRLRLLYQPSDDFRAFLTAQYFDEDRNGAAQKGIADTTPNPRELRQDELSEYALTSELYSIVLEKDFDGFTFKSISSYQKDDILIRRDNDRHDFNAANNDFFLNSYFDPETNVQKTITQEFNLISNDPAFGVLDWVVGAFYLDTEIDIMIRERLDLWQVDGNLEPYTVAAVSSEEPGTSSSSEVGFISDSFPERESISVYAQGTLNFSESARIIAGLRYTEDEVYSEVTNFFGRFGTDILEIESDKVTGRLALEVDVNDSAMSYISYTRGFKPGGSNLTFGREEIVAPIVVLPVYKEEVVDAFEIGLKTDLLEGRIRLNAAAFLYDYEGLQYQATEAEIFQGGVGNIPEAEIKGFELEAMAFLTDNLVLDARLAWLDTEITKDHFAIDNVLSDDANDSLLFTTCGGNLFCDEIQVARYDVLQNINGNELAKTPSFTSNVSLNWNKEMTSAMRKVVLSYTYRGDFQHRIFNNSITDNVPSYEVFDLMVGYYSFAESSPFVEFIAKNLGGEDGVNARMTDVFGVGATGDELIAPKQLMIRIGQKF